MNELSIIEVRVIIYSFLFLFTISVFGLLRLFNALVTANRLLIKLKESILRLESKILLAEKTDNRNQNAFNSKIQSLTSGIKLLIASIDGLYNRTNKKDN